MDCENGCTCTDPDNGPACTVQVDTCKAGCAVKYLSEGCQDFIINLVGDILVVEGGEVVGVILLLLGAARCVVSLPG